MKLFGLFKDRRRDTLKCRWGSDGGFKIGTSPVHRIEVLFAWYDLWVGVYISDEHIYICPLPTLAIRIRRKWS